MCEKWSGSKARSWGTFWLNQSAKPLFLKLIMNKWNFQVLSDNLTIQKRERKM